MMSESVGSSVSEGLAAHATSLLGSILRDGMRGRPRNSVILTHDASKMRGRHSYALGSGSGCNPYFSCSASRFVRCGSATEIGNRDPNSSGHRIVGKSRQQPNRQHTVINMWSNTSQNHEEETRKLIMMLREENERLTFQVKGMDRHVHELQRHVRELGHHMCKLHEEMRCMREEMRNRR
mmetsp:Transcript_21651/g.60266  ORF Transcript_21651/g.60266 Transcript_21651/m.60266 type:complete len:180 (-) Transcript_21651:379-918(-)